MRVLGAPPIALEYIQSSEKTVIALLTVVVGIVDCGWQGKKERNRKSPESEVGPTIRFARACGLSKHQSFESIMYEGYSAKEHVTKSLIKCSFTVAIRLLGDT